MKKKKVAKVDTKKSPYKFDTTKTYIIPMRDRKDRLNRHIEPVPTECHIIIKDRMVMVEERHDMIFADTNFDWYLHTGYIKIKNE